MWYRCNLGLLSQRPDAKRRAAVEHAVAAAVRGVCGSVAVDGVE